MRQALDVTLLLEPGATPDTGHDLAIVTTRFDETRADITAAGALVGAGARLLHEVLDAHMRAARLYLRLDLSKVDQIDDAGAATLAGAHERLFARHGTLILTQVSAQARAALDARGLERRLLILGAVV